MVDLAVAQSGLLDVTFGQNGEVVIDVDDLDRVQGIVSDEFDNIYFYGGVSESQGGIYPFDFFIGKLFADGTIDYSFGDNGFLRGDFPDHEISIFKKACMSQDGIILIGNAKNFGQTDTNNFYLAKVSLDGTIDTSFANSGFFTDTLLGIYNTPGSVIVDSDEKIVFCGSTTDFQSTYVEYPFVGRLLQDGQRDLSFGQIGIILYDYYSNNLVDAFHIPDHAERHGEGAYLDELIEIENNYFLAGKFTNTSFDQIHLMSFTKQGTFNPDFVAQGLYSLQIDPGSNHQINDIEKLDTMLYIAMSTTGALFEHQQLLIPVSMNGYVESPIHFEHSEQEEQTNFLEVHHEMILMGGYSEEMDNGIPGHFSDQFVCYAVDQNESFTPNFGNNGRFTYHSSALDFEQGAIDGVIVNQKLILAGYANRIDGANVTDFMLVSVVIEDDLEIQEKQPHEHVYPNPTTGHFRIPNNATDVNCWTTDGTAVPFEQTPNGAIEILSENAMIFFIHYSLEGTRRIEKVIKL